MIERLLQPRQIDLVVEKGADVVLVEIKSARTPSGAFFSAFERFAETVKDRQAPRIAGRIVVCGGDESQERSRGRLLSWRDVDRHDWL